MKEPGHFIRLNERDNVLIARTDCASGTAVVEGVRANAAIPSGHKVALCDIPAGTPILKYATVIGFATCDISAGDHVHRHNVGLSEYERDYAFCADAKTTEFIEPARRATFQGICRADGRVATRNYIGVMATVNCSASVCQFIADHFRGAEMEAFPNVDGVVALGHSTGCGMDANTGLTVLRRTLTGYARNPNFAGLIVIGLGCERNQIMQLMASDGLQDFETLQTFNIQDVGGTKAAVEKGIAQVRAMLPAANRVTRETASAEHLCVALQCGGSDGLSGLTANPALGHAMDILVRNGGTAVLSETPEIYGAEHILTRRARSPEVGEKLLERIRWWQNHALGESNQMNNNPPPGNTEGGLATIFEKSLGGVMKAGTTQLNAVYEYAERFDEKGLVFMDAPGFDPVAATGQVAGGANVICFTTGRGSVFGCKPVPSIKLASNTAMYQRMRDDMDINCGAIIDGEVSIEQKGREIFETILAIASGTQTKSEELGMGSAEFVPWRIGAVS